MATERPSRGSRSRGRPGGGRPGRPQRPRHETARTEPPPDVEPRDLDPELLRELRSLPRELADRVARHLVAAAREYDDDPEAAYRQAAAARTLAARVAVVREACGLAAYRIGRYAEALAELRAVGRMTGSVEYLPVMADSERGLGRPERALALAAGPDARRLDTAGRVEMRIVAAGARRDLGQPEAAVVALQCAELDSGQVADWTVRLWYAYADALLAAGRVAEARDWFLATARLDESGETDAAERVAGLPTTGPAPAGPATG
jgi:tetratricopeptide (TPR) repeat protein